MVAPYGQSTYGSNLYSLGYQELVGLLSSGVSAEGAIYRSRLLGGELATDVVLSGVLNRAGVQQFAGTLLVDIVTTPARITAIRDMAGKLIASVEMTAPGLRNLVRRFEGALGASFSVSGELRRTRGLKAHLTASTTLSGDVHAGSLWENETDPDAPWVPVPAPDEIWVPIDPGNKPWVMPN